MSKAVPGEWNIICQICRKKCKSSKAKKRWDGYITCGSRGCWEPRQPLDMPPPRVKESPALPFTSPPQVVTTTGVVAASEDLPTSPFTTNNSTL